MHFIITHHPRNGRQGVKMGNARLFGRKEAEHQINRHVICRVKGHR